MEKTIFNVLKFISAIILFVIMLATAIEFATFSTGFFERKYEEFGVAEEIGISKEDLAIVTAKLLDYMKGATEDLEVVVNIKGKDREFFNQREKDHMFDVKRLFSIGFNVRNLGLMTWIGIVFYLIKKGDQDNIGKIYISVFLGIATLIGLLVFIISTDFNKYFTIFHEIFFTNDLWILNPETDLLINLVPQQFFVDISLRIINLFAIFFVPVIISCLQHIYMSYKKEK